jgi:sugar phosphate isomerase/epimerase
VTTPLALSTMYFQRWSDATDLAPFFAAGIEMGFEAFELSHILAPDTVTRIDPAAARITAVHHPCPRPEAFDESDRLTSSNPAARRRAVAALCQSVETAVHLGASSVVVHLGYVEDTPDRQLARLRFELESRYRAGRSATPEYQAVLEALVERVSVAEADHLERALAGLTEIVVRAQDAGVALGIETGYHAHELPTAAGMPGLLASFPPYVLGAWLDTGHVGAQVNLGLSSFAAWFEAVGSRWVGAHFHDIVGLRDHLIPGMGSLDFAGLAAALPPSACHTCEFDWYFSPAVVLAGAAVLRAALAGGGRI